MTVGPLRFGAFLLAVALAVYPLLWGTAIPPLALPGSLAVLLYAMAVGGIWPGGLSGAVLLLAIEYLASLYLRGIQLDVTAPAYAACLFVCAELGWLIVDGRGAGPGWLARWFTIAALALAAAALGWAVLIVATLPLAGGLAITGLGVVAALAEDPRAASLVTLIQK